MLLPTTFYVLISLLVIGTIVLLVLIWDYEPTKEDLLETNLIEFKHQYQH